MSNRKTKYITVLGFMSTLVISAQDTVRKVARDSSDIDVNYFEEGLTKRYSGNEFDYSINDTGGVNMVQRVLQKFFGWLSDLFGFDISFINYKTLEYIIYGLLGCGALYLLIKFLFLGKKTDNKIFFKL